ncbi:MAG: protein jag [Candidatus Aminicenantaceae bacterium]
MEKEEKNNNKKEFKGKNLKEAIGLAEHMLKLSRDGINYEIVAEKTKLFGIKSKEIVIRAWPKEKEEENHVVEFLEKFLNLVPLELEFQIKSKNDIIYVIFEGKDKNLLLRKEASLLLALQHILNKIFSQKIQADCDFYRKRRERKLKEYAMSVAHYVSETGKNEILEMMNPYERRIIHLAVNQIPGITSESIGEGFLKRVKIFPINSQAK